MTSEINFSMLTWTYYVFNELKVIIMGNGYGILNYGVLDTSLLLPLITLNGNSHVQVNEPPKYSPKPRRAGRDTGTRTSCFFLRQLA